MMKLYGLKILFLLIYFSVQPVQAQISFETVAIFPAEEAHQAVAVDSNHFYAIASRSIGKYDKETGGKVDVWKEKEDGPVLHLDSGVILDGKMYAAHSNYPEIPMTSSVEVWDTDSMMHYGSYSFGINKGSLTWIDRHNGFWWGTFAHYDEFERETGKDNRWTTLVRFDDEWNILDSWVFPEEILDRFDGKSNSGGSWGPDGLLYLSGHDRGELYAVRLPEAGSELVLVDIIPVESEGQGIAWDPSEPGTLYTIIRSTREVVISKIRE